jgi:hypothetical protein
MAGCSERLAPDSRAPLSSDEEAAALGAGVKNDRMVWRLPSPMPFFVGAMASSECGKERKKKVVCKAPLRVNNGWDSESTSLEGASECLLIKSENSCDHVIAKALTKTGVWEAFSQPSVLEKRPPSGLRARFRRYFSKPRLVKPKEKLLVPGRLRGEG